MTNNPQSFVSETSAEVRPLEKDYYLAEWEAAVQGSDQAIKELRDAQFRYLRFWSDPGLYATARQLYEEKGVSDSLLARQIKLIYLLCAQNQQDESTIGQLTELESRIRDRYYNYRGRVEDRELNDNELDDIIKHSRDSEQVQAAWEASKRIGGQVASEVREIAKLRNTAARQQGFRDHFERALVLDEIDEKQLLALFSELEEKSDEPFARLKKELDGVLSARFGIAEDDLRPWHYGDRYFQDGPELSEVDLDSLFAGKNLEEAATRTYSGLGMDARRILARSDLYSRPGKNQHAFCIHIDRNGDIRTLNNLRSNQRWAETLLHELGHGMYEQYLDPELPWLLRAPAHTFTTEAVAILLGSLTYDPRWLVEILGVPAQQADRQAELVLRNERARKLIFTRWCLLVTHFERQLYKDPEADLDTVWWDLAERYQLLRRPEERHAPDWAAKIHIALVPVYYHNYQLGHLMAAQLRDSLYSEAGGFFGEPEAGRWLIERIFRPGASLEWSSLIEQACGEPLNPTYFIANIS
jgi:peptidyl-dipeptidase A